MTSTQRAILNAIDWLAKCIGKAGDMLGDTRLATMSRNIMAASESKPCPTCGVIHPADRACNPAHIEYRRIRNERLNALWQELSAGVTWRDIFTDTETAAEHSRQGQLHHTQRR